MAFDSVKHPENFYFAGVKGSDIAKDPSKYSYMRNKRSGLAYDYLMGTNFFSGDDDDDNGGGGGASVPTADQQQIFQPHMPGGLGMIAKQLSAGYGQQGLTEGAANDWLSSFYSPMTLNRFLDPNTGSRVLDSLLINRKNKD